jgi:regulator of replication initiation timing
MARDRYSLLEHKAYAEAFDRVTQLESRLSEVEENLENLRGQLEEAMAAAETLAIDALLNERLKPKAQAAHDAAAQVEARLKEVEAARDLLRKGVERLSTVAEAAREDAAKLLRGKARRDHERAVRRAIAALDELAAAIQEEAEIRGAIEKALGLKSAPGLVAVKGTDADPGSRDNTYTAFGWLIRRLQNAGYEV